MIPYERYSIFLLTLVALPMALHPAMFASDAIEQYVRDVIPTLNDQAELKKLHKSALAEYELLTTFEKLKSRAPYAQEVGDRISRMTQRAQKYVAKHPESTLVILAQAQGSMVSGIRSDAIMDVACETVADLSIAYKFRLSGQKMWHQVRCLHKKLTERIKSDRADDPLSTKEYNELNPRKLLSYLKKQRQGAGDNLLRFFIDQTEQTILNHEETGERHQLAGDLIDYKEETSIFPQHGAARLFQQGLAFDSKGNAPGFMTIPYFIEYHKHCDMLQKFTGTAADYDRLAGALRSRIAELRLVAQPVPTISESPLVGLHQECKKVYQPLPDTMVEPNHSAAAIDPVEVITLRPTPRNLLQHSLLTDFKSIMEKWPCNVYKDEEDRWQDYRYARHDSSAMTNYRLFALTDAPFTAKTKPLHLKGDPRVINAMKTFREGDSKADPLHGIHPCMIPYIIERGSFSQLVKQKNTHVCNYNIPAKITHNGQTQQVILTLAHDRKNIVYHLFAKPIHNPKQLLSWLAFLSSNDDQLRQELLPETIQ